MSAIYLDVLQVPVSDGVMLLLADDAMDAPRDALKEIKGLPSAWKGRESSKQPKSLKPQDRPAIIVDADLTGSGMHPVQIHELRSIYWDLIVSGSKPSAEEFVVSSSLAGSARDHDWRPKKQKGSHHGTFAFVNYLGASWLKIQTPHSASEPFAFHFDVITAKLDYAAEYKTMVEAIGNQCHQLLLEWNSPTSVNISQDNFRNSQTLLEQFLFLRHVLGPDRLELFLEVLHRQPHSRLIQETSWLPSASADARLFVCDPLRFGRDWQSAEPGRTGMVANWNAAEILTERKFDSTDTPPNRFVKFALETFRTVCDDVVDCEFTDPGPPRRTRNLRNEQGAAWQEAVQMRNAIDSFLAAPFFREVGRLSRVPYESQTLQKREGYREILHAFLMLDAAAQIDWPGRNDAYDGTNRDVATLYEFWLYFVLVRAFEDKLKMHRIPDPSDTEVDGARPFCCTGDNGRMMIHLKRDEASFCRFTWENGSGRLRLHFFYNRQFKRSEVHDRGTYSKVFRPDFSLVIIPGDITEPDWEKAEEVAEEQGRIAYLHFDAKYRVDRLTAVIGETEEESAEDRRTAKATGKFKNEDLYKMHTYAEAIRRTIGAYVLYPGDDPMNERNKNRFERYHEIIPGVGAFALRPNVAGEKVDPVGLPFFADFLQKILTHQANKFTQSHRINFWTHDTIREQPTNAVASLPEFPATTKPPQDTQVLLGFVRDDQGAEACRLASVFYCHAVEWKSAKSVEPGEATDLKFDPFRCDFFVAYQAGRTSGWVAKVKAVKLVSAKERADELHQPLEKMNAAYYYRFQLEEIQNIAPRNVSKLVHRRPGKPIARSLSDFALCPVIPIPQT